MNEKEYMLTALLECDRTELYAEKKELNDRQKAKFERMQQRRAKGEPLQYILGRCDFMGRTFFVDESVLIPRPETEILVDTAIQKLKLDQRGSALRILDLGTGSGNIAITLAKEFPNARITALDISKEAIILARDNAFTHDVFDQIDFAREDMRKYLAADIDQKYDLIISNPPYIARKDLNALPEDVQREPQLALDAGEDGLDFYRVIFKHAHKFLVEGGMIFVEIGDGQRTAIEELVARKSCYEGLEFIQDYTGTDRISYLVKRESC